MNGASPTGENARARRRRLTTILSADLCGYTGLSERDPDGALVAVEELTARVTGIAGARGGRLFHRAGDGYLAELPSATEGLRAAEDIHESLREAPIIAAGGPVQVRIGVHTGEAAEEADGDLLGHAVNVAARLQGEAARGGTVLSGAVRQLSQASVPMRRMGELRLKNLREPVMAYEVLENPSLAARLRAAIGTRWVRRNAPAFAIVGVLVLVAALAMTANMVSRDRALRAERAAEAREAQLAEEAARLADQLTAENERLLDRDSVERAALSLLSSEEPEKAEARRLALENRPLDTARALREAYDAQAEAGADDAALAETALQCGAFAFGRDQALAQWAYERAYEALPREPFVLARLADIGRDRGRTEDARSYYAALLAASADAAWRIEADEALAFMATSDRDLEEAERRLQRALATARASDLTQKEARLLAALGWLRFVEASEMEDESDREALFRRAEGQLERSLRIFRALRDVDGTVDVLKSLASLASQRGETEDAIRRYEEVYAIVAEDGDATELSSLAFNLASSHGTAGNKDERDAYWSIAYEKAEAGAVDAMLPLLHAMKAGHAFGDGAPEEACAELRAAAALGSSDDVERMRQAMIPDLECPVAAE